LILDLFRKPKVTVEYSDAGILVTLPGTGVSVIYVKTDDNKLIASAFSSARGLPEKHQLSFPQFLALAGRRQMRRPGNSAGSLREMHYGRMDI